MNKHINSASATLVLRLILGWTYFSAFWRRLALAPKLDMDSPSWIGIKFNYFLPNALGIKPIIEFMVENPDILQINMIAFTVVEGIVGLLLILGIASRSMAVIAMMLAGGILLGSGWLGSTCLDEWQIGILGLASGFLIATLGTGQFGLDNKVLSKLPFLKRIEESIGGFFRSTKVFLFGSILIFFVALATNQIFHGGLWGELHNLSKSPKIELTDSEIKRDSLILELTRVEGIDVYGNYMVKAEIVGAHGQRKTVNGSQFSSLKIVNHRPAEVYTTEHALAVELGSRGEVYFPLQGIDSPRKIIFYDVNGDEYEFEL